MTVRPEHTYAVAIGVDTYDVTRPGWPLPAARRDAIAFAEWLRAKKVPAENISLVTSGTKRDLPGLLSGCRLEWPRADLIRALLANHLGGKKADLLVVYWSGHGELAKHDERLLLSDTTDELRATIRTEDLRDALASKPFQHYSRKVLIVDACRAKGGLTAAEPVRIDLGEFVPPRVALLQSAAQGDKATAGDFGERFLEQLNKAEWPPDFEAIGRELAAEVEPGETHPIPPQTPAPLPERPALFCDRKDVADEFRSRMQTAFKQSSRPVLCLVHAENDHRPDSCVERLMEEINLDQRTAFHPVEVTWDNQNAKKTRRELSEKLLSDTGLIPPAEFARRIPERKTKPFLMVWHSIESWTGTSADTLKEYLDFWSEWPALPESQARVFVFFSIFRWKPRRDWRKFWMVPAPPLERALAGLARPETALTLDDLPFVTREDLRRLLRNLRPQWTNAYRDDRVAQILGTKESVPMHVVELTVTREFLEKGTS